MIGNSSENYGGGLTEMFRKHAHESGDGVTIRHCPLCGSGQVIGRSDGNTECSFCNSAFLVRVQPMYSAFPQSVGGVPVQIPGMPAPAAGPMGAGAPPGAPGGDEGGNPFGQDGEGQDGAADEASEGGAPPFTGGEGGKSSGGGEKKDDGGGRPPSKKESYRTGGGALISRESYLAYLAGRLQ